MKPSTETLIKALRILANDIQSEDGVANSAIREAADRLEKLSSDTELVAWWSGEPDTYILPDAEYQRVKANKNFDAIRRLKPLYTAPPKREPLSQEEVKRVITPIAKTYGIEPSLGRCEWEVIRAIEKAHGITDEPQEPMS